MGEWIRHRGSKSMPKRLEGMRFEVKMRDGEVREMDSEVIGIRHPESWVNEGWHYEVVKYRILGPIGEPKLPDTDGWIEWHGGECPVVKGTLVYIKIDGYSEPQISEDATEWLWSAGINDGYGAITHYRLSKPDWPEDRVDVIGQNGNTGEHYAIDTLPKRVENESETVHVDMVNEPPHYKQGDVECIDAIRSALTDEEWRGYCKGNALKYIWRERHKGGDESLQKADWYLNRLNK